MSQSDVYVQGDFSEPMSAQHSFSNMFDLNDPAKAAADYSKIMRAHTQRQYELASRAGDRRSPGPSHASSLSTQSSVDSTASSSSGDMRD